MKTIQGPAMPPNEVAFVDPKSGMVVGRITNLATYQPDPAEEAFHASPEGKRRAAKLLRDQAARHLAEAARLEAASQAGGVARVGTSLDAAVLRDGLTAAIRAAKLALFLLQRHGADLNGSWRRGFERDLSVARTALAAVPPQ